MHTYTPQVFNLPELQGLSQEQIDAHLGLYKGYVTHVNLIGEQLASVRSGELKVNPYVVSELRRRFAFEFDGMRMHEYYFTQFEGGATAINEESHFAKSVGEKYGSTEGFVSHIKEVATTRGIGWVVVYYDDVAKSVHTTFVADHELGQLAGLPVILALDVWEHAFMVDYLPSEKGKYLDAFLSNLNWSVVEKRFEETQN